MLITLDAVQFRGDMSRAMFTVEHGALSGWFEAPGVRRENTSRPTGDGSFTAPTYRAGRSVGWHGLIHSKSHAEQRHAMEQLAGMCSGRGLYRLTVQHGTDATWADVQLVQAPGVAILAAGRLARYDVEVFAPDPRRYGEVRSFSSGATAYHRGNAPAYPLIRIASAPAAYTITSPGGTFTVSGATSGGTHVVDMRTGRVTRNGALMPGVSAGATWAVPPGAGWAHTVSGGTATIELADTFF